MLSYQFVFFVCFQLFFSFLKIAFFKEGVQFFSIFSVLSYVFENSLFLGLLKHIKNKGFSIWGFFVVERRKQEKMITEIYEFWFFWSKNGRFVTHNCFSKKRPETPNFIVFFGCAFFGPRCQKREILKSHPKKRKKFD